MTSRFSRWFLLQLAVFGFGCGEATTLNGQLLNVDGSLINATTFLCSGLTPHHRLSVDVTGILESCAAQTPVNGILELPPGEFTIRRTWDIQTPITVRTHGKTASMAKCNAVAAPDCAELVMRGASVIQVILRAGAALDHIVVNGNRYERLGRDLDAQVPRPTICAGQIEITSDVRVTNSVSKYAPCNTSAGVAIDSRNVHIANNTFAYNGFHHFPSWSDGLTVPNAIDSQFLNNEFVDNTDVQLIFGGCRNCAIQGNVLRHTNTFSGGSFADLLLSAMVIQGGSYLGSDISGNHVDCGPEKRCGFGLSYGNESWVTAQAIIEGIREGWRLGGGVVRDNTVANAQFGINIGQTTSSVEFSNNRVTNSGGSFITSCGSKASGPYNIIPAAIVDISRETPGTVYSSDDWVDCIPNWHTLPYGTNDTSEAAILAPVGVQKLSIACPDSLVPGQTAQCDAWGWGHFVSGHWLVNGSRISRCDNSLSCSFPNAPGGTYDVKVVGQTSSGLVTSNTYRIEVSNSQPITISCPPAATAWGSVTCSVISGNGTFLSGYWRFDGVRQCDNQPSCVVSGVPPGGHQMVAIAQTPEGEVRSNVVAIGVNPPAQSPIAVSCPSTVQAGTPFTCSASSTIPLSSGHWLFDGRRFSPCDNQPQCSGSLGRGAYSVQLIGVRGGVEIRSNIASLVVTP